MALSLISVAVLNFPKGSAATAEPA
jgi:hypothetical protein